MNRAALTALLAACSIAQAAFGGTATLVLEARLQGYRFRGDEALMQGATCRFYAVFDTDAAPIGTTADSATYEAASLYEFVGRPLGATNLRQDSPPGPGGATLRLVQGDTNDLVVIDFGDGLNGFAGFSGATIRLDPGFFPGSAPPALDTLGALPAPPDSAFSNIDLTAPVCTQPEDEPYCVTLAGGGLSNPYLINAPRYMLIDGPAIVDQPVAVAVDAGNTISLTTGAAGFSAPVYQWFRNGEPLGNAGRISGTDTPALTITNAALVDNGAYTAHVTENGSTTVSDTAVVAVIPGANCSSADLSMPFGLLDLADVTAFASAFIAGDSLADLDGSGLLDLADISAFVTAFLAGCP